MEWCFAAVAAAVSAVVAAASVVVAAAVAADAAAAFAASSAVAAVGDEPRGICLSDLHRRRNHSMSVRITPALSD